MRMRRGREMTASRLAPAQWLSAAPISLRRLFCAAHAILIALLSLAPGRAFEAIPPLFPGADKLAHCLAYAALALLLIWAASPVPGRATPRLLALCVASCFAYGALLEAAQGILRPGDRMVSALDMAANAIGSVLAASSWKLNTRGLKGSRAP